MSLLYLHVKDFAVFEDAEITFSPGLNAITGESGSGKSLLLEALRLLTGGRAQGGVVRSGAREAYLEAVFDVGPHNLDAADEEGQVIVSRQLGESGRSLFRLNGRAVSAQVLKELGPALVEVVGQGEGSELLDLAYQRDLLDRVAGTAPILEERRAKERELRETQRQMAESGGDGRERENRLSFLAYQIREIEEAHVREGEEQELRARRRLLSERADLLEALSRGREALMGGGRPGAYDLLARTTADVARFTDLREDLAAWQGEASGLLSLLQDLGQRLAEMAAELEADPHELDVVEQRLLMLEDLKRKFGSSEAEILTCLAKSRAEIEELQRAGERAQELALQRDGLVADITRLDAEILERRRRAAPGFEAAVVAELDEMGFEDPGFEVRISGDQVAFWFRPNPGEASRPLREIASGGEQSRVLLALKAFQTEVGGPAVILDEVDQGLGGDTVRKVASLLGRLAEHSQVIAVTHQAALAVRASTHIGLEKEVRGGRTWTVARALEGEERVREVARMLAGSGDKAGIEHARILVQGGA